MARKLALALRLLLGAVFLYAAYTKLRQPWLVFAMSIDSYQLLPPWAVFTVARVLPWFEVLVGILLLWGRFLRYTAPAVAVLMLGFEAVMLHAYLKGLAIDCGCFGAGEAISPLTLTRDGLLLACGLALCVLAFRQPRAAC